MKESGGAGGSVTHSSANTSPLKSSRQMLTGGAQIGIFERGVPSHMKIICDSGDGGFVEVLGNAKQDGSSQSR